MMETPFIKVENLHVNAAGRQLVSNVSFEAMPGRVLGLVGESGSGKSLTCLSMLDLLPQGLEWEGDISVEGNRLHGAALKKMRSRRIGMILQNPMSCFDPVFTIRTHFRETLAAHNATAQNSEDQILNALEEVGFPDPAHVPDLYPFQMSGGMLQRVMVALALILDVPFLIADEPTTDLDTVAQARILDLLAGFKSQRGLGMLLVTHDLGVIARLADDVAVMHDGRIIEQGTVHEIFRNPQHEYTQSLINTHLEFSGYNMEASDNVCC